MSFLLPYLKERPTLYTVPASHEDKDSDVEETGSDEDNEGRTASPEVNIPQKSPLCEATVAQPSTFKRTQAISESSLNSNTPVPKRARIRRTPTPQNTSSETPSTSLMKIILENITKAKDIQLFFDGMATTVQSFPPRDRAVAKAKVFAVISQMELEILGRNPSTSSEYVGSPASCETC